MAVISMKITREFTVEMKIVLILLLSASAIAAPNNNHAVFENNEQPINGNPIDELWIKALEFIRKLLQTYEPFELPEMPEQTVTGDDINLIAKFKHVKVSKASDFTIDHIENHLIGMNAIFNVTVPQMHLEGDYSVQGTIRGKAVKSSSDGHFILDISNLKVGGYVKVALKVTYLQMTQLEIEYAVQGVKFDETGLEVDGMSEKEIKELFTDASLLKYFQENEHFVCEQVSNYVMKISNQIMHDKSLAGLLQWLKDVIDGKIIPTPPSL